MRDIQTCYCNFPALTYVKKSKDLLCSSLSNASIVILENNLFHLQEVQHNCQLHRISFCADDKTDKRIFTFICKDSESNKHLCYVFDSEKCVSMQDALKEFGRLLQTLVCFEVKQQWLIKADSLPFNWRGHFDIIFHASIVSCNLDALIQRRTFFFIDLRWFSGTILLTTQLNILGQASAILSENRLQPSKLEMFAQLFCRDCCNPMAEIPSQALLLMCLPQIFYFYF